VVSARDPRLLEIIESMAEEGHIGLLGTLLKPVQLDALGSCWRAPATRPSRVRLAPSRTSLASMSWRRR
jgi:hypothetical protein